MKNALQPGFKLRVLALVFLLIFLSDSLVFAWSINDRIFKSDDETWLSVSETAAAGIGGPLIVRWSWNKAFKNTDTTSDFAKSVVFERVCLSHVIAIGILLVIPAKAPHDNDPWGANPAMLAMVWTPIDAGISAYKFNKVKNRAKNSSEKKGEYSLDIRPIFGPGRTGILLTKNF